ncbi:hypothetical protein ACW6AV_003666 [Edwardsiella piscicida]|uniref:hypothetical protein n=1 Tax=Edwardsiella piscicida TaxID=1263550 RepID=UPI000D512EDA|nr:hypothetical protein [Edwardsiella piscicida]QBB13878.1 hypothetical protein EVK84_15665 [Edwardsiella piscicida]UCQ29776.1 hypothetical protein DCF74_09720 [Edwardsiella piscicida]UCQ36431.1 hypothetical protein DCF36_09240 [Edwardsiella piscicida]
MTTITKDQALAVSDLKAGYTLGHADVSIMKELARIALAALEAEPVAMDGLKRAVEFYEQVKHENTPTETGVWKDAVNWVIEEACRAAMLKSSGE